MNKLENLIEQNIPTSLPHTFLAWLKDRVILGTWSSHDGLAYCGDCFDTEEVLQMRIFNDQGELYLYRIGDDLKHRYQDKAIDENCYIQKPFMWGNECRDDIMIFEKNRGMKLISPFKVTKEMLPLRYEVINYYKYDDHSGQIVFTDARLTAILDKHGNKLEIQS